MEKSELNNEQVEEVSAGVNRITSASASRQEDVVESQSDNTSTEGTQSTLGVPLVMH